TGAGRDKIALYSDAGEPDPAQTDGAEGRQTPAVDPATANDVVVGGQGKDVYFFNLLLNATDEVKAQHTRADGSINWRGVAGENDNPHDHWVEGIGDDVVKGYSNQDGDQIVIRGHTVEIASITYGDDEEGSFSLITLRSQQGNGGAGGANTATGAHDEDPLGSIKVYGDKVTEDDINLQTKNVFDGVDKLETIAPSPEATPAAEEPAPGGETFSGGNFSETILLGSGQQTVDGNAGSDRIISYGDGGEPDPAQTDGAEGRVNPPVPDGSADDTITGGSGRDIFEFRALLNAKQHVIDEYTREDGTINWRGVAGENDHVHDHWVQGWGHETILDYTRAEGDKIIIRGHTVEVAEITYGADEGGSFSLIRVISQQGDGGAGGANTATGAHDEDELGTIKVYGDKVELGDLKVQANVFDGIDQLAQVDKLAGLNGGSQEIGSRTDGEVIETAPASVKTSDYVRLGEGAQTVNAGAGRDKITLYSDAGEPDPAQTDGAIGRQTPAVDPATANDDVSGGQGKDVFTFNFLLNATDEVKAQHTRADGSINWRGVAGENDNPHDHWVEGIGDDVVRDFSNQDGDQIVLRGHTVEIAAITYGEDEGGDFSLITVRSQQGNGGAGGANTETGAHDEDPLGTIKVYGDKVTETDIKVQAAGVFDGVDKLETIAPSASLAALIEAQAMAVAAEQKMDGSNRSDTIMLGSGQQVAEGDAGWDRIISYADGGEPDPAQTEGAIGRVNPAIAEGSANDTLMGGTGGDRFEFRALLNAKQHVIDEYTREDGTINWRGVAGENDQVHDHWVEGWGDDTILDFSKAERDKIIIRGHTVEVAAITYGEDEGGSYSLVRVISQQGNGGAGGANTATGAHDEDELGTIKVYGDKVELDDLTVQAKNVFDGIDQLAEANKRADLNGGSQEFGSRTGETIDTAPALIKTYDYVRAGEGAQIVNAGAGRDTIVAYSDAGEPDPAQTDGAIGRQTDAVDPAAANDEFRGGQGKDLFLFNFLLNATDEVKAQHTRADGSVNWRGVAGENDNVHDHWVEGIGNDIVWDYSNQDGDKIILRGHTVEIASITYGEDEHGDFSLVTVRSQQGNGGAGGANTETGAHDEDPLGTIKFYGDKVTENDIKVQAAGVFDGVDKLETIDQAPQTYVTADNAPAAPVTFTGTDNSETFVAGAGQQTVNAGKGWDRIISYGDDGEPDPAQTNGAIGRVTAAVAAGASADILIGGEGGDRFEFRALLNAKQEILELHTREDGTVNWRGVAGENDQVHNHWVEGWGDDVIMDYSKDQRDKIIIRGHTVEVASITYGADDGGAFSLITVISQQGDGGAGGINTATGAHDEDPLGTIKVYGDTVTMDDLTVQAANVFDGIDQLQHANTYAAYNGGSQEFGSRNHGEEVKSAPDAVMTNDFIKVGEGAQMVDAGAGRDKITSYSDGGEPAPAQLGGEGGTVNPPIDPALAADILAGGQGADTFTFNFLLNAKQEILDKHTRDDGSVNWRGVAGENDNVHDHWVEGIGNDTVLDYSNQDGDKIILRGHTVEIAGIDYGEDALGDFSLISVRSQQGDGGGAHDEDHLGTVKVYGDLVDEDDIIVQAKGVFDGIDKLDEIPVSPAFTPTAPLVFLPDDPELLV
ncbi:MAG: hypothetical protein AAF441_22700, partial [Pseudomonadota bacterium]